MQFPYAATGWTYRASEYFLIVDKTHN